MVSVMKILKVSVCIPAYNEERNIIKILKALLSQRTRYVHIDEIIIISSGSTDRTNYIVKIFEKIDKRVRLIEEPLRRGKASAINVLIRESRNDICVLESADTVPRPDSIELICLPFMRNDIGMTGAHIIPKLSDTRNIIEKIGLTIWHLHHIVSLISSKPKLGEVIAFRKSLIKFIPPDIITDEAYIQGVIEKRGFRSFYVPQAIVHNKVPETLRELFNQRVRIYIGHLDLAHRYGYSVPTMNVKTLIRALSVYYRNFNNLKILILTIIIELLARIVALLRYHTRSIGKYARWDVLKSTKYIP